VKLNWSRLLEVADVVSSLEEIHGVKTKLAAISLSDSGVRLSRFPTDYIVRKLASHVCELDIIVYKLYSSSQTGWEYRELISQVCDRTGQFVNPD